jgi:replicative DNA helicase
MVDPAAERAVLAGLFAYGSEVFDDAADFVTTASFTIDSNQAIFSCLEYLLKDKPDVRVDYPSFLSAAQALGLSHLFKEKDELTHLRAVMNMPVRQENVRKLAGKLNKLEIAREGDRQLGRAQQSLRDVTGDEPIDDILNLIENPVFDLTSKLANTRRNGPEQLGVGLRDYVRYLAENQREMVGLSSGYPQYDLAIGGGFRDCTVNIWAARMKAGKAQSLDSLVYTPTGPKRMGDIRLDDEVCTPDGGTAKVVAIHPQGVVDLYRVTFRGGDTVECCGEHLWEVHDIKTKRWAIKTTTFLKSKLMAGAVQPRWSVRLPQPCYYRSQTVPMDAYALGVLIGNGGMTGTGVTLTSADQEIVDRVNETVEFPYRFKKTTSKYGYLLTAGRTGRKNKYAQILAGLGLRGKNGHHKFIPEVYKFNSQHVRWALVQGLFDTDGYVDEGGKVEYSTTSERLALDLKEVLESLGCTCTVKPRYTSCNGKRFFSYRCHVGIDDSKRLFLLSRKTARGRVRSKPSLRRRINKIEYVGKKEAQCITLDSAEGLYLTDHHIVTHNSIAADNVAYHVTDKLGVDVLMLDTELSKEDHWNRMLANISGVSIREIETGQYARSVKSKEAIYKAIDKLEKLRYHYISIAGQPFEDTISLIRRWRTRTVGVGKPCLVILDYLKLMSAEPIQNRLAEFQVLGFMMTALHNSTVRWKYPCLSFVQTNREGITREDTDVVAQSDRIGWLCSNLSILKKKSDEEMRDNSKYNRKLVVLAARHGPGLEEGDYINMKFEGHLGRLTEGPLKSQMETAGNANRGISIGATDEQLDF